MTNSFGLIALDMDGTLLRADKTIHPDTAEDIAAAAAAGIEVAYCTGRSPVELLPYVKDLPAMRYAIALSGAYVCDLDGGCIFERRIPQKLALRLAEEGERYGAMVQFLKSDRSIVRADLIPRMAEFHMAAFQTLYEQVATGVSDLTDGALSQNGVHKINIYFRNTEDRDKAYDALKDLPLTFALTENTMLEAGAAGVSKAEGLRALADHLHIPISATMAIGDSDNDIPVLQAAGFSVAMKNSEEKVIALCDAVTDDNENNGVGKAIRRYCLAACPDPGIVNGSASFPEAAGESEL